MGANRGTPSTSSASKVWGGAGGAHRAPSATTASPPPDNFLLYMDPHYCQPFVDTTAASFPLEVCVGGAAHTDPFFLGGGCDAHPSPPPLQSFRCSSPRKMPFSKMDPSCALGFYARRGHDLDRLCAELRRVSASNGGRNQRPPLTTPPSLTTTPPHRCNPPQLLHPPLPQPPPSPQSPPCFCDPPPITVTPPPVSMTPNAHLCDPPPTSL